jgi:hypothetical protein
MPRTLVLVTRITAAVATLATAACSAAPTAPAGRPQDRSTTPRDVIVDAPSMDGGYSNPNG